jgi:hypothetical protein
MAVKKSTERCRSTQIGLNILANWEKVHECKSPKRSESSSIRSSGERFESVSDIERALSTLLGSRCVISWIADSTNDRFERISLHRKEGTIEWQNTCDRSRKSREREEYSKSRKPENGKGLFGSKPTKVP